MDCALADDTFIDRARILVVQRRYDLAERELGRALELNPNNPQTYDLLAVCRTHAGDHRAAHQLARRLIELAPTAARAYTRHAWTILADPAYAPPDRGFWKVAYWSRDGDARMAKVMCLLREALRLAPDDAYAWYLLGLAWLATDRPKPALGAANKGLEFDPEDLPLLELRAVALEQLGRLDEALATTRAALALDPQHAPMLSRRGAILLESGQHDEAVHCLRDAVRRDPMAENARQGLADALQHAHPLLRWGYRLHQPLYRRGLLKPYGLVMWGMIMLFAGVMVDAQLDLVGPPQRLVHCATVIVALGLPLSIVWLRHAGRAALSRHPRHRHLLPLDARFVSHLVCYAWPPLLATWLLSALDVPNAVTGAAVLAAVPLAAATAPAPSPHRRWFLSYAAAFTLAAVAVAAVGPDKAHPAHGEVLIAGLLAAAAPVAAMTRLARRRILA